MKNLWIIFAMITSIAPCQAETKTQSIGLQTNKVCQIILPSKIEKIRGGFDPDLFVFEQYENILYIQCLAKFPSTNISIITEDFSFYLIDLFYTETASKNAYILQEDDRIYVAAFVPQATQNTSIINNVNPTSSRNKTSAPITQSDFQLILQQKDFFVANNGVADKAMEVFIKGIYTRDNYVYFKLDITNNSELPYSYNYCGFAVTSKKRGKTSSYERVELLPVENYVPSTTLEYKQKTTVIYKFEKFNFSNDRVLQIEMIENNGERGLSFKLTSSQLLKARKI